MMSFLNFHCPNFAVFLPPILEISTSDKMLIKNLIVSLIFSEIRLEKFERYTKYINIAICSEICFINLYY